MPNWAERRRLAVLLLCGSLPAQAPLEFRTADGSRFVLLPQAGGAPLVHWVLATPADAAAQPAGMGSLGFACAKASLRGTWSTGSRDAQPERAALAALDRALAERHALRGSGPAQIGQADERLQRARAAAAALCDPQAFRRQLAAAPAIDVAVQVLPDCLLFAATTTAAGVEPLGRLLVERREHCALRGLDVEFAALQNAAAARWDQDPLAPLRAEALALAFAGHPLAHAASRPLLAPVERQLALRSWQRTQQPSRCVHVLTGSFDPAQLRPLLERVFAATALPPDAAAPAPLPPLLATRRSLIAGGVPSCVIGWRLDGSEDVAALAAAARWLGQGDGSLLPQQLARAGRTDVEVVCRAPWPDPSGPGLFLVEVRQPAGSTAGLADQVLELCRAAARAEPEPDLCEALQREQLRQHLAEARDPEAMARRLAAELLLPQAQASPTPLSPQRIAAAFAAVLQNGPPVVVEGGAP